MWDLDWEWLAELGLASLVVAAFATSNFNRPSWSRSYTTSLRYHAALVAHAGFYVGVMLAWSWILVRVFTIYSGSTNASSAPTTQDVLWLAFLLTLAVRATPIISRRLRAWVHGLAGIPHKAREFAQHLAGGEVDAPEKTRAQARSLLQSRGIADEADLLPLARPVHALLLKATMLFIQLRSWDEAPQFRAFLREASNDMDTLRTRFDRMSFRISRALNSIERLGEIRFLYANPEMPQPEAAAEMDELMRIVVKDLISDCCEDIESFHESACLLAARGTLATRTTRKGRDTLIAAMGFQSTRDRKPSVYWLLAGLGVALYAGMTVYFNMLPPNQAGISLGALVNVVSLIVFGSVAIAVLPKLRWGFANSGLHDRTPVPFVVGAGFCATLWAVAVNLAAGALIHGPELGVAAGALRRLQGGAPFLPAAFVTASTVAWLIQDHRWGFHTDPTKRRLFDALTLGGAWVCTTLLGLVLQVEMRDATLDPADLVLPAVGAFVIGGLLASLVAETVRFNELRPTQRIPLPLPDPVTGPMPQLTT